MQIVMESTSMQVDSMLLAYAELLPLLTPGDVCIVRAVDTFGPMDVGPDIPGWCLLTNGEGDDFLFHNGKLRGKGLWSARGSWWLTVEVDGRKFHCYGSNMPSAHGSWTETL